jgi:hypothetical protein
MGGYTNGSVLEGFLVIEKKNDFPLKINTLFDEEMWLFRIK